MTLDDLPNCYNGYSDTYDKACIIGVLEELPSAEKHGRWILKMTHEDEYGNKQFRYFCSECGASAYEFSQPYCHHCGARMDEVEK